MSSLTQALSVSCFAEEVLHDLPPVLCADLRSLRGVVARCIHNKRRHVLFAASDIKNLHLDPCLRLETEHDDVAQLPDAEGSVLRLEIA